MTHILPRTFGSISEHDNMFLREDPLAHEKYFGVGLNALMLIRQILQARRLHPETILDLPSGFGRVTRFLRAAYPHATIYASDVNIHATRFCANFGASPLPTAGSFDDIVQAIPTQVDLVWTGSLITPTCQCP